MVLIEARTLIEAPIERCFDLARCIDVHLSGAGRSREKAISGVTTGLISAGQSVTWSARHLGVRQQLTSKITAFNAPIYFQDTMVHGAFKYMQHDHYFAAQSTAVTEMKDRFNFAAPLPIIGRLAESIFLRRYMTNFLLERNRVLKLIAESAQWRSYLSPG
ncbi:MAG TPA: SRPBCC family protein [Acidisarcina sp.]